MVSDGMELGSCVVVVEMGEYWAGVSGDMSGVVVVVVVVSRDVGVWVSEESCNDVVVLRSSGVRGEVIVVR